MKNLIRSELLELEYFDVSMNVLVRITPEGLPK